MTDIGKQILRASALYLTVLLSLSTTVSANTVWLTDLNAEVTSGQVERLVQDLKAA